MDNQFDKYGRITRLAKDGLNNDLPQTWPVNFIIDKLNWYRSFFGKIQDLSNSNFEDLKENIGLFFNLKPVRLAAKTPRFLIRISNNSNILNSQKKPLSYLSNLDDLLAPPLKLCKFNRCNLENQQVVYCALDEASAYWETRPKKGDVITLTTFLLKESESLVCSVIKSTNLKREDLDHPLKIVYNLLDEFFVEVFTLSVDRKRPRDYLFSAALASGQLFYPIQSPDNIESIVFPSVQRGMNGNNIAIPIEILKSKYYIKTIETRFMLDEYSELNPKSQDITSDQVIGSFYTYGVNYENREILYSPKVDEIFNLFRSIQTSKPGQIRYDNGPSIPKNLRFNLSPLNFKIPNYLKEFVNKSEED